MQDQVAALKKMGVAAAMLSSKTSQEEQNVVRNLLFGHRVHTVTWADVDDAI